MSDVSSGHTEIIPSQSSVSESEWSDDHQVEDRDTRDTEMISSRSSSSNSQYSDGHEAEGGDGFDQESEGRQVKDGDGCAESELPDGVEAVPGSKSVTYQGHTYAFYHGRVTTRNYRCNVYRRTGCLVKLYISRMGVVVHGRHKSDCVPELRQVPTGPTPTFVNWKQQMLLATDEIGIRDVTLTPGDVWRLNRERFYSDDNIVVQGATKKQILGRLYRTRRNHFGREFLGAWKRNLCVDVKHSPGLTFFKLHFTYYEDEVLHRVIGWAHPKLMDRMKQRQCFIFIDATYRCIPTRFYQVETDKDFKTQSDVSKVEELGILIHS